TAITIALREYSLADEQTLIAQHSRLLDPTAAAPASRIAEDWITRIRSTGSATGIEALLLEFPLSTAEGVALMCLAEALLRIPDPAVADRLIRDVLDPIRSEERRVGKEGRSRWWEHR